MGTSTNGRRVFIARHGETVFNKIARMQGQREVHTPLTWDRSEEHTSELQSR